MNKRERYIIDVMLGNYKKKTQSCCDLLFVSSGGERSPFLNKFTVLDITALYDFLTEMNFSNVPDMEVCRNFLYVF